jgi:hypothetical protein
MVNDLNLNGKAGETVGQQKAIVAIKTIWYFEKLSI